MEAEGLAYRVGDDLETLQHLLGVSEADLAASMGVSHMSLRNWKASSSRITMANLNGIYDFAYKRGIRLNRIKEQLYTEECVNKKDIAVFHGSKSGIAGPLSLEGLRANNDFGCGFYCGDNFTQSAMFVANYPGSSVYAVGFDSTGLSEQRYFVDEDWMLTIAYFRGRLAGYADHARVKNLVERVKSADYIVAPIADNRMYQIMDSFIDGEITNIQCEHCLSATNLGMQYVFTSRRALDHVELLEKCFLSEAEKQAYQASRQEETRVGIDKSKTARRTYRGQGRYIDEVLK